MSLLKHGSQYLFGRAFPGLIHLAALAVFSRLLSPEAYGQYALVITGVGLANAVLFQWLRQGLLRFWPIYETCQEKILSTVLTGFCGLVLGTGILLLAGFILVDDSDLMILLALGLALLWAEAMFALCQQLERSKMLPLRYAMMGFFKAAASLLIGWVLVLLGFGVTGLLVGTLAGYVLPLIWEVRLYSGLVRLRQVDWGLLMRLFKYGLPLTATFALGFFMRSCDRALLAYFFGAEEVGYYAVGANLAQQTISMLMMVVNLAAFPLAVNALEKFGRDAANSQLKQNLTLLFAISLPASVGVCLLASNIAMVLLGEAFRNIASAVIPIITFGAFLAGLKGFYFDLSFQLGQSTIGQVWVNLVAAVTNIVLNLLLIPRFGVIGAASGTVLAYMVGMIFSIVWGGKVFRLPVPGKNIFKIAVATAGMTLALLPFRSYRGAGALTIQVLVGGGSFAILIWKLGILQSFREASLSKSFCQKV